MRYAAYALLCAASLFFFLKGSLLALHMLQLNSYKFVRYFDWCAGNLKRLLLPSLPLALLLEAGAALVKENGENIGYIAAGGCAVIILLCGLIKNPPQKKKLVFTSRAKRLLITSLIIAVGCCVGGAFLPLWAAMKLLLPLCFGWIIMILSAALNAPIDRAIYCKYFNMARKKLAGSNATVIGITGSYGKTSTKYILGKILSPHFNTLITPESYNTPMGVSKVINGQLKSTHEIFIAEMGAGCVGDIAELCRLCSPGYGVISSIGPQHLKTMHTIENIISTKFELADSVGSHGGVMFLNYDNEYIAAHGCGCECVKYGINYKDGDYRAEDIRAGAEGLSFTIVDSKGVKTEMKTSLLGRHNVINILAAVAVAEKLGIPAAKTAASVARLEAVPHRLALHANPGGVNIIDDAYNSNPAGAAAALEALSWFEGLKVCVTPGMVELGGREQSENRELGRKAAAVCDKLILVGGKRRDDIMEGALEAGFDRANIICTDTFAEAAQIFGAWRGATVLLENDLPDNY